ncbi:hypothetical protein PSAC2689_210060 [Paraburkholderia sacchari]
MRLSALSCVCVCRAAIDEGQSSDWLTLLKMMFFHFLIRKSGKDGGTGRLSRFSFVIAPVWAGESAVATPPG